MKNVIVIIDCGHAKNTPGKCYEGFYEYSWNREEAEILKAELLKRGYQVSYTVDLKDVKDKSLQDRVKTANNIISLNPKHHCLYVSVHADAENSCKARGWSIWTARGMADSDKLAEKIIRHADSKLPDIGMKVRKNASKVYEEDFEAGFYVIQHTNCPAVLIEHFFFTNAKDQEIAKTGHAKQIFAEATSNGIDDFVEEMKW